MNGKTAALYARVSSQQQREDQTIASQLAALERYATEHGYVVPEQWTFLDEGYTGATLLRPGLERLRDLVAQEQPDVVLVHSPDRLARKYAYQVIVVEELRRGGVEVIFLKSSHGDSPEDELLLQFQGMIAEYERALIAERTRRGRIHRARAGDVGVMSSAPYGYRYVRKTDSAAAYFEIIESEAQVVREIFRLCTTNGYALNEVKRHLNDRGVPTRTGKPHWCRTTVWGILRNPAYQGRAAYGKTRVVERVPRLTRPTRQHGRVRSPWRAHEERPRQEWIEIPVPAIVDEMTFALAAEQLQRNKHFARRRTKEASLLQGMLVCRRCGYAFCRTSAKTAKRTIRYYRCTGSDGYRWEEGRRLCSNTPVRQDYLDQVVWDAVVELLSDHSLVRQELDRRLEEQRCSNPTQNQKQRLERELTRHRKAMGRLIEAYQEELITLEELRTRMPELRSRENGVTAQLGALAAQLVDREVYLRVAANVERFLSALRERAQTLSVDERQKVLRLVVKEVQVDQQQVIIKHSIRPPEGESGLGYRLRPRLEAAPSL